MRNGEQQKSVCENSVISSLNPATREIIGQFPVTSEKEIHSCVQMARESLTLWQDFGFEKRVRIMKNAQQLLMEQGEEIAGYITLEMGRPFVEALAMEVFSTIDLMGYYIRNSGKLLKSLLNGIQMDRESTCQC